MAYKNKHSEHLFSGHNKKQFELKYFLERRKKKTHNLAFALYFLIFQKF